MLPKFKENGNTRMARLLEENPVTLKVPLPPAYAAARDEAMHTLGIGATRDMNSVVTGIFLPSWQSPEYTLGEKINLWCGKLFSHAILWDEMIGTDLIQKVTELKIPVYFSMENTTIPAPIFWQRVILSKSKRQLKGFTRFKSLHTARF